MEYDLQFELRSKRISTQLHNFSKKFSKIAKIISQRSE